MPYLGMDLDAKKKIPLVANALGLHPGIVAWGLLNLWEYCWANNVEVVSELVLSGCVGDVRLPEVLEAYGFLERVPKGWTSEITTQPIPADAWRVRGAKKYLNLKAGNSKGGHAAKGNLIPGGPKRVRSAGAEGEPRVSPAADSARPRPFTQHPAPSTHDQDLEALAGASGGPPLQSELPVVVPSRTADPVDALKDEWNSRPELPAWLQTGKERRRKALLRLEERPMDGPTGWREVIRRIAGSDFCLGKSPGRNGAAPWRATPDWLVANGENAVKVLEGKYDNPGGPRRDVPACEVCGDPCKFQEHGHDLCEECRYRRFGEGGTEWKPGDTEESAAEVVAAWILAERERRQKP